DQIDSVFDKDVYGSDGERIGGVKQVYTNDESGQPEWLTVSTGLFGTKETFIPLTDADLSGDRVTVPFTKAEVKDAPKVDVDGHLSPEEEQQLYSYYGRTDYDRPDYDRTDYDSRDGDSTRDDVTVGTTRGAAGDRTVGHDTSGPTTDDAMTVSEEQLHVGTERREAGRARLKKYVVTENVTQTVPVQREEVRLEREPITDSNVGDATAGPAISEEEHEVVLHEERPVVQKETVPVERVRLDTDTVTEQETVSDEVRKERVEVDGDTVTDVDDSSSPRR
ncbi:MAG TPA: PRC and DUF2382 domain-containing protein, partial [Microlunatus sp.]|nr:PRC and DUF2382 domain-containing protein [Microlunatus sp.]